MREQCPPTDLESVHSIGRMSEKKWNKEKGNWEVDGTPVTYRVTWRSVDGGGEHHEREFSNIDHGYDFYQDMLKYAGAYAVTWEHTPF